MVQKEVCITNITGLHLRPAGDLCTEANKFQSHITMQYGRITMNAKSVLSVLAGGIRSGGVTVQLVCEGPDEQEALDDLSDYIEHYEMTK